MKRWISSAALRLFAKVSVRRPRSTKQRLEARRLGERRAAQAELPVEQRRVPEHDRALGARRCVVADHGHRLAEERRAELAGVRDGRRGEQELRLSAVDCRRADAAAAARSRRASRRRRGRRAPRRRSRSGDSRARRPSGRGSGSSPTWTMSGLVRITFAKLADLPALLGRRVAVVDRRPSRGTRSAGERAELVLRERLRRIEVERAALRVGARARRARAG